MIFKRLKMKRYISIAASAICFISLFLAIGIVGSIECETVSIQKGLSSIFIYLVVAIISAIACNYFDE